MASLEDAIKPTCWQELLESGRLAGSGDGLEKSWKEQVLKHEGPNGPARRIYMIEEPARCPGRNAEQDGKKRSGINRNSDARKDDDL